MKTYLLNSLDAKGILELTRRPAIDFEKTYKIVRPILNEIQKKGLKSALKYAKQFDAFSSSSIYVTGKEFLEADKSLSKNVKNALESAYSNILAFHKEKVPGTINKETQPGVICSREFRPIDNVGLYIPGGNAVLPSTVLMLGRSEEHTSELQSLRHLVC